MPVVLMVLFLAGANHVLAEPNKIGAMTSDRYCIRCHTGPVIHENVTSNNCDLCHNATDNNTLQKHSVYPIKDPKSCYHCHPVRTNEKSVHPLIQAEECSVCHMPKNWPMKRLPREKVLTLCLRCHKHVLLEQHDTPKSTRFQNHGKNLHYIHAGEKTKIPCLTCHDGHGSNQLHLIRLRRTNSREALTIIYTANEKGGKCTASCHTTLGYERN